MAIQAQPETIFGTLSEQVHNALTGAPYSEFDLKRWAREADKLANASRAEALEVKAYIAAIEQNFSECDQLYSAALKVTSDYTSVLVRYLVVLSHSLRADKLFETFSAARESLKGDIEATRYVETLLASEGFLVTAQSLGADLKKMGTYSGSDDVAASELATQWIDFSDCDDMDFVEPISFTKRFLESRKIRALSFRLCPAASEDGSGGFFYQVTVDESPEAAIQSEWDLYAALEEKSFPKEVSGRIGFGLVGARVELG